MLPDYFPLLATGVAGLGLLTYNLCDYYATKKELQQIAMKEGRNKAIKVIHWDKEFEAEELGLRIVNYTHGLGEKLARRRFLAGKF